MQTVISKTISRSNVYCIAMLYLVNSSNHKRSSSLGVSVAKVCANQRFRVIFLKFAMSTKLSIDHCANDVLPHSVELSTMEVQFRHAQAFSPRRSHNTCSFDLESLPLDSLLMVAKFCLCNSFHMRVSTLRPPICITREPIIPIRL